MTEIEELLRWCHGVGNYPIIAVIKRFLLLPEESREALRERWKREDADGGARLYRLDS